MAEMQPVARRLCWQLVAVRSVHAQGCIVCRHSENQNMWKLSCQGHGCPVRNKCFLYGVFCFLTKLLSKSKAQVHGWCTLDKRGTVIVACQIVPFVQERGWYTTGKCIYSIDYLLLVYFYNLLISFDEQNCSVVVSHFLKSSEHLPLAASPTSATGCRDCLSSKINWASWSGPIKWRGLWKHAWPVVQFNQNYLGRETT